MLDSNRSPSIHLQGKCTCLKPVAPTIYGTAANGAAANGYLSYPSTPVPPHHGKNLYQLTVCLLLPALCLLLT